MHAQAKTKSKAISYVICKTVEGEFDPICGHFSTQREAERMLLYWQDQANQRAARKNKYARHFPKPGDGLYIVRSEWTRITPSRRQVHPRKKAA